jgi:transcriptional regulator with XRE-family HTH domain
LDAHIAAAFGVVLRALRTERGMTQEQFGVAAGLQRKHISRLELGEMSPSLGTVLRIARALKIEPGVLVMLAAAMIDEPEGGAGEESSAVD